MQDIRQCVASVERFLVRPSDLTLQWIIRPIQSMLESFGRHVPLLDRTIPQIPASQAPALVPGDAVSVTLSRTEEDERGDDSPATIGVGLSTTEAATVQPSAATVDDGTSSSTSAAPVQPSAATEDQDTLGIAPTRAMQDQEAPVYSPGHMSAWFMDHYHPR